MTDIDFKEKFTPDFEEKIIQALLADETFGSQLIEVIEPHVFSQKYIQEVSNIVKNYFGKYKTFPTISTLNQICKSDLEDEAIQHKCFAFLNKIKNTSLNGDSQYVKDKSLIFFRTKAVQKALVDEVLPKLRDYNLEEIVPIIQTAISKGIDRNIGLDYNLDENRFIEDSSDKIPSPWPYINGLLNGGWQKKRLWTLIAPSGAGKSHGLVNIGCGALRAGKVVVHYSLELEERDIAKRYDANLADVEINQIPKNKELVLERLKSRLPTNSKLIIKEYPMKSASVATIQNHLEKLKLQEIIPDIILIDYGDLLRADTNFKEKRHGLSVIWEDMKKLAQLKQVPVITVTQTNRTGFNSDIITLDQVGEDIQKICHSDGIITMAQTLDQKVTGVGKIYFGKNRQGADGIICSYIINKAKCKIDIFELAHEDETSEVSNQINATNNVSSALSGYLSKQNFGKQTRHYE